MENRWAVSMLRLPYFCASGWVEEKGPRDPKSATDNHGSNTEKEVTIQANAVSQGFRLFFLAEDQIFCRDALGNSELSRESGE